jgi:prophage antirepressor-like protein
MPGDLCIHQFPATGQTIRTVLRDAEPWVVAADACAALDITNPRSSLALLDEDEKGVHTMDTLGGPQQMAVVNEPGLYSLILRSRKPEAKAFKRWITHEVLPAIRKTGSYGTAVIPDMGTPEGRLQILDMAMRAERRALESEQRIKELEPEAARARQTIDADGLSLVGTVAKRFGIKEKALRQFLYGEGILIEGGMRRNEPMARYVQSGHFELKTRPVEIDPDGPPTMKSTTYVTPKGEALIWKRLHDAGLVRSPEMPSRQLELLPA